MPRFPRKQLSPWIREMILNFGDPEEEEASGLLRAYVISMCQMSQSQAQFTDDPKTVLFLSDGSLQIPAVLTAAAWKRLQEDEDRESFSSLLNSTVCMRDYRLRFHAAAEQNRCRFFLSVGELATVSAGLAREPTPCCTSVASVRLKICQMWEKHLFHEMQEEPCGELTELLGEWHHDCVHEVTDDIRKTLMAASRRPVSPQPSTSTQTAAPTCPTRTGTPWDVDRVRFKALKPFSVPVKCLLIPEENDHTAQTPDHNSPSPVSETNWQIPAAIMAEQNLGDDQISNLVAEHFEDTAPLVIDNDVQLRTNPWDVYSPPGSSSPSSSASLVAVPASAEGEPVSFESPPDRAAPAMTSTQLPVGGTKEPERMLDGSGGANSDLPPYQKPPLSVSPASTAAPPVTPPGTTTPQNRSAAAEQEEAEQEEAEHATTKRRRSNDSSEEAPSWLFKTQQDSGAKESRVRRSNGDSVSARKTPRVHRCGRAFSYTYKTSTQNLQDFSSVMVAESLLHWAVRYLVSETAGPPQ